MCQGKHKNVDGLWPKDTIQEERGQLISIEERVHIASQGRTGGKPYTSMRSKVELVGCEQQQH